MGRGLQHIQIGHVDQRIPHRADVAGARAALREGRRARSFLRALSTDSGAVSAAQEQRFEAVLQRLAGVEAGAVGELFQAGVSAQLARLFPVSPGRNGERDRKAPGVLPVHFKSPCATARRRDGGLMPALSFRVAFQRNPELNRHA